MKENGMHFATTTIKQNIIFKITIPSSPISGEGGIFLWIFLKNKIKIK